MADAKVSWIEFDTAASCDVRVSWLELDTAATDVKVSWICHDTNATPCDVKVSWVCLDTSAPQITEPSPVSGGGSGGGGPVSRFSKPKKRTAPLEIPIAEHNEDDEEEIVLALLMRIAEMELV